jgi:L-ascorbate metabolism protein UlaG (beta-lactamase superfamily)
MRITKFGHSCLLVEENNVRVLIDPGAFSNSQNTVENLDAILITHEHQDHLSIESLQAILAKNPDAKIFTNPGVGQKLSEVGINFSLLLDKEVTTIKNVRIEGVGTNHAFIYANLPIVRNTGYIINDKLFYPGDALTLPDRPIDILAYPTVAPWMKIGEAIDYGKAVKPKIAFPVHDGFLKFGGPYYRMAEIEFTAIGTKWVVIEDNTSVEF